MEGIWKSFGSDWNRSVSKAKRVVLPVIASELFGEVNATEVILPAWHEVSFDDVRKYSVTLADRLADQTSQSLGVVVQSIMDVISNADVSETTQSSSREIQPLSVRT